MRRRVARLCTNRRCIRDAGLSSLQFVASERRDQGMRHADNGKRRVQVAPLRIALYFSISTVADRRDYRHRIDQIEYI